MSEDINNDEPKKDELPKKQPRGIPVGITPVQITILGEALKTLGEVNKRQLDGIYEAVSMMKHPLVDAATAFQNVFDNLRAFYPLIHNVETLSDDEKTQIAPRILELSNDLDKVEDAINTVPENGDELSVEERQRLFDQLEFHRSEIERIEASLQVSDLQAGTQETDSKESTKMAWNTKYVMVFGQTFRNQDFYMTEEYSEMMRLWNKLNEDQFFDLPMEVMRENPEAIRLWELFAKANNLHSNGSEDIKAIREEVARTRQAVEFLASEDVKSQKTIAKRGPNLETLEKIKQLAKNREEQISKNKLISGWVISCQNVGINSETARINAPILRSKWSDKSYHWNEQDENW